MIMTIFKKKQLYVIGITVLIALAVILLYPLGSRMLSVLRTHSYMYSYSVPKDLVVEDTSKLPPAEAVPILMYHGVIANGEDVGPNTDRKTFIEQMEMLKRKGYETISVKEYDLFREGKFTLPPKPIIITFDDGRKDSFYTTDEILKKLGFKATLFVATIKANENEPFYLSWDELAKVKNTSRWEIEAHGRRSHEEVPTDEKGTFGRYLTSRIYTPGKGLESIEAYKKRVKQDYINGLVDLKKHLNIDSLYFAVPFNNYGIDESNYEEAYTYNQELTHEFFKLGFVEAEQVDGIALSSFYNYRDSSPTIGIERLEVKNSSSDDLLKSLERFSPKPAALVFSGGEVTKSFLQSTRLLYGTLTTNNGITLLSSPSKPSARMLFGDNGWKNYSIKTRIVREKGRSVSVISYYTDEDNFISLDWGDKSLQLIERKDGKERELAWYYPWEKKGEIEILLRVRNGYVSAYFNGQVLARGLPIKLSRGAAGLGVWDPEGAESTIKMLEIVSIDQ